MNAALARDCLAAVELALDAAGWPYRRSLSLYIDLLTIVIEENDAA